MTFLAPGFLWAAAAAGLITALLHLLAWRRPRVMPLPTARFIPERPMRVVARAVQPSDLWLLALRLALVACLGVALARPVLAPPRSGHARVILADVSRAVASAEEVRDSVKALEREGGDDVVLAFDSTARVVDAGVLDSLSGVVDRSRGRISAALVAAVREAGRLSRTHDSVSVILVSPVVAEEWDAATIAAGRQVPGGLRVARVRAAAPVSALPVTVRAADDDPVLLAVARSRGLVEPSDAGVRVVRDAVTAADSAWAQGTDHVLVVWPADTGKPGDTLGAVVAGANVFAASLVRGSRPDDGRVVARWVDGEPAATEVAIGEGCLRSVAVPVPLVGDAALSIGFSRFLAAMVEACGGASSNAPASAAMLSQLERDTRAVAPMRSGALDSSRLPAWLLATALALMLLEPVVRRRVQR